MIRHRSRGWIGVDVGTRTVKLAQVERVGVSMRLRQAMVLKRTTTWQSHDDGSEMSVDSSRDEIRAGLSLGEHFSGRRAACILPMGLHDLRTLSIPPGRPEERRSMIASELRSIFGSSTSDREFDYWETDLPGITSQSDTENVNVMSLSRQWASQAPTDLERAGLRCEVLDGPPLALARAVQITSPATHSAPVAAVDWGFANTTFCVVADGRALFTRRARACNLGRVIEAIGQALDVSLDESEHLLATHGLPDPTNDEEHLRDIQTVIAEAASSSLNEFLEQLNKTLSYLNVHRQNITPKRIWLFGGGARIKNVSAYLSGSLGIPIDAWSFPMAEPASKSDANFPPVMLGPAIALSALAWTRS